MNTDSPLDPRLDELGRALHAATTDDLLRTAAAPRRTARRRRATLGVLTAVVLGVPGVAVAANALTSHEEVARGLPGGTTLFAGSTANCDVVRDGIEFDCTLSPAPDPSYLGGGWMNTVEPTLDDTSHVNGGCRAQDHDGTRWRCYIGQEAVRQKTIGSSLLGSQGGPSAG